MSDPVHVARSRLGVAVQRGKPEGIRAARQVLAAAHLERAIRTAYTNVPPLTEQDRVRLVGLMINGGGGSGG